MGVVGFRHIVVAPALVLALAGPAGCGGGGSRTSPRRRPRRHRWPGERPAPGRRRPAPSRPPRRQGAQALAALGPPAMVDCALRAFVDRRAHTIATDADLLASLTPTFPDAAAVLTRYASDPEGGCREHRERAVSRPGAS